MTRPSFVVPIRKDLLGYTHPSAKILGVDKATHSATFVLATLIIDRDGEIVHPRGCLKRLGTYKRNPIVLYDHEGRPIGLSQTPAGACTVRMEGEDLVGTNYFQFPPGPTGKLARDVWECVSWEPPVLRMASVGFIPHELRPLDSRVLRPDGKGGVRAKTGNEYTDWELTEWSITPLGANQQAMRHDLKRMSVVIQKSFAAASTMQATRETTYMQTRFSKATHSKRQAAAAFKRLGNDPSLWIVGQNAKAWTFTLKKKEGEDDETAAETATEETPKPKEKPAETETEKPKDDDGSQRPFAKALRDLHNHHKGLADYAAETAPTHDHPEGLALLQKHATHAGEMIEECKGFAKEHYPDLDFEKFCKSETPDENGEEGAGDDDDTDDSAALDEFDDDVDEAQDDMERERDAKRGKGAVTKKYHMKSEHASAVRDASEFLGDLATREDVPKSYRGGCKLHAGELTKMLQGNGDTNRDGELEAGKGDDEEDAAMEKVLKDSLLVFKSAKTA